MHFACYSIRLQNSIRFDRFPQHKKPHAPEQACAGNEDAAVLHDWSLRPQCRKSRHSRKSGQVSLTCPLQTAKNACLAESLGGKDSVKGNRQGFLSRSITRRSGRIAKSCYNNPFCNSESSLSKKPKGTFFDKLKRAGQIDLSAYFRSFAPSAQATPKQVNIITR